MPWNGRPVVVAPLVLTGVLLAATLVAPASSRASAQDANALPPDQLILTRGVEREPMSRSVDLLRARLRSLAGAKGAAGGELRQEVRPLPPSAVADGTRDVAGHLGLAVYRALKEAHVANGYALDFFEGSGVLRACGFDLRRGVEATFAVKLENDKRGRAADGAGEAGTEPEPDEKREQDQDGEKDDDVESGCRRAIDGMVAALEVEQQAADATDAPDAKGHVPGDEAASWSGAEDPPELGFRWEYVRAGAESLAQVTLVFENSPLGAAGLRRGDRIATVNGQPVPSPPRFGHAVGGLRAGAALELEVRRGAEPVAERIVVKGRVARASEVIPAWEQKEVGAKLPTFRATIGGAPVDVGAAAPAVATVVCLFDPRRPDTLRDAAQLAWLRDHYAPGEVAIAGIAVRADDARLKAVADELAGGWPAVADPDGRLAESTRTITLPALLVADRDGVVRFRRARGGALQRALQSLLAANH